MADEESQTWQGEHGSWVKATRISAGSEGAGKWWAEGTLYSPFRTCFLGHSGAFATSDEAIRACLTSLRAALEK